MTTLGYYNRGTRTSSPRSNFHRLDWPTCLVFAARSTMPIHGIYITVGRRRGVRNISPVRESLSWEYSYQWIAVVKITNIVARISSGLFYVHRGNLSVVHELILPRGQRESSFFFAVRAVTFLPSRQRPVWLYNVRLHFANSPHGALIEMSRVALGRGAGKGHVDRSTGVERARGSSKLWLTRNETRAVDALWIFCKGWLGNFRSSTPFINNL